MKRMHEFLGPNVSEWRARYTGTGTMTQDGTVICTNDEDLINANASTVYQFDHFDQKTGKFIYRLVSNQFTFPSASVENLKEYGVRFDIDDQSLWSTDITVNYYGSIVETAGLYAVPKKKASGEGTEYILFNEPAHNYVEIATAGYLDLITWLKGLKDYFISKGCNTTEDGYQAIIPGQYIEIVSHTVENTAAKITILPQEIAIEPERNPLFRLITTQE